MFGIDSTVLAFVLLAGLSAGAIAYAFLFSRISDEKNVDKRLQSIKAAETDRAVVKASRDRVAEAARRRKSVQDSLKELDDKQRAQNVNDILTLILDHDLPREAIPTQWLNERDVWEALLEGMPMEAMIRNLAKMTDVGLIAPMSGASKKIVTELGNAERIKKARLHPIKVLAALKTYAKGRGERGKLTCLIGLQNLAGRQR